MALGRRALGAGRAGTLGTRARSEQAAGGRWHWRRRAALGRAGHWGARQQAARARGALGRGHGSRHGRAQSTRGWAGWAAGARPGSWARGLGARAGLGQCTRCTRPIFDSF